MTITQEKLNRIYVRYCQATGLPATASAKKSFSQAIEFIEQRFNPEYINLTALGSSNEETVAEHKNHWLVICEILNSSLSKEAPYIFSESKARSASIIADQHIDYTSVMALHGAQANLGIREKCIKGALSSHEWLIDLDLQRMLQLTDTQDKIHVLTFDEKTIGTTIHFEREKAHADISYTIPLLLNKGSDGAHHGIHWLAATITIDEVAHEISYTITDSMDVSEAEKHNYDALIKRAITYHETTKAGETVFKAFPENAWTITGKVVSQDQKDSYSCGYRAIHNLFQDKTLIGQNELANSYRLIKADGEALAKAFYQAQLENFVIQPSVFQEINHQQRKLFLPETGKVRRLSPIALSDLLNAKEIGPTEDKAYHLSHPSVNDAISKLDNTSSVFSFPGVENRSLTVSDYEDLFKELHAKLTTLDTRLIELSLRPCDETALDGLNAYCQLNAGIRAANLTIEINPNVNPDEFIKNLQLTLINLAANSFPKVTFIDAEGVLKEKHWKNIAEFIANNTLAIEIDLPKAYLTSAMQRTIDEQASINQRTKNKQNLNENTPQLASAIFERVAKRKRPTLDTRAGLNIDIELQQEQQVEVQVATQMTSGTSEEMAGFGDIQALTLDDLEKAIKEEKLNHPAVNLITAKALKKIWHTWMGDIALIEKDGNRHDFLLSDVEGDPVIHHRNTFSRLSLAAAQELLVHHHQFKEGLNAGHLPKGFVIVPEPGKADCFILHYDSKVVSQNNDTVTPVIKKRELPPALAADVCENLLGKLTTNPFIGEYWKDLNDGQYARADVMMFRRYLPELMLFTAGQQQLFQQLRNKTPQRLAYICQHYQQINDVFKGKAATADNQEVYDRLVKEFTRQDADILISLSHSLVTTPEDNAPHLFFTLLDNQPELKQQVMTWAVKLGFNKRQINALLRVYSEYGEEGLTQLFHDWSLLDADLLKELHDTIYKHALSFSSMITEPRTKDALQIVSGIKQDKAQYEWWSTLLKQHVASTGFDSFPDLVEAFITFSKTIKAYNLDFYPNVAFANVNSLPTVLGRILTILSQSQPDERDAQWQCITEIPLQANGAIRALADLHLAGKRFGFVVPEMLTTPVHYDTTYGYSTSMEWRKVASEDSLIQTRENFYRYIANQKHRLPLSFYQEMDKTINKALQFNDEQKARLYAILAESTTGETNSEMSANIEQSKQNWIDIIDKLTNMKLPLVFKPFSNSLRNQLVERLYQLKNLPSLPILQKLSALMAQTLTVGITKIKQKADELAASCNKLEKFTNRFGNSIYVGMSFYTEDTYMNSDEPIFYRHLDVAYSIAWAPSEADNLEHYKQLIALISTFGLANGTKEENEKQGKNIRHLLDRALFYYKNHLKTAMSLLADIDKRGNPPLSPNDLQQFLTDFVNKGRFADTKAIQDFVKSRFEANFPQDYFERLQADTIPLDVQQLIDSKFESSERAKILEILNHFITPGDAQLYMDVTRNLTAIINNMSKDERFNFLNKLTTDVLFSDATIADFNQLLITIKNDESANDFLFFLSKAEDAPKPVLGVLAKLQVYLKTILPRMARVESKVVRRMDSLNLIIDLLLATSPDKLDAIPNVKREDDDNFQRLFSELNSSPDTIDSQELAQEINAFIKQIPGADSLVELKRLRTHLDELHAPEPPPPADVKIDETVPQEKIAPNLLKKAASFFSGLLKRASKKEPVKEVVKPVIQPVMVVVKKPKILNRELVNLAKEELATIIEKRKQFDNVFVDLFLTINQVAEHYAGDKQVVINYLQHFLTKNNSTDEQIVFAWNNINLLKNEFIALNDADIVRSLCDQFNQDSGDFTPFTLVELLSSPDYQSFKEQEYKTLFLNILTSLMNNSKACSLEEFESLLKQCRGEQGPVILAALKKIYGSAPFPSLKMFDRWRADCPENEDLSAFLDNQYSAFDKQPCERETGNGFNLVKARAQANLMSGVVYTDEELSQIDEEVKKVRDLTTEEIKFELGELRAKTRAINNDRLVALVAELLYRTKGLPLLLDSEGKPKSGRSFEIHTTQYLAIHSMLKSGRHVTGEIGTGEGKSRIMMLMIACQYALGQTVDFVTADVELAYRDYSSFRSFFQAMGAKTNLIYQTTPANDYAIDGINFSDAANLSLFRNRARSEGLADVVIAREPMNRALLLDEADRAYFDLADTRFNYSALANETIRDMQWVYDVMVGFFSQPSSSIMDLYQNDIDACNKQLMAYASKEVGPELAKRLSGVSQAQVESWQQSALTALALELDSDFVIKSDIEIETAKGPKIVSEARLLIGNRENRSSKFSFGVHQCLHARLNRLKANPHKAREQEAALVARLSECKPDFFIDNEKQIVYSSTSKSMLSEYESGSLYAVTGTAGSIREREEAAVLYGQGEGNKMGFITIPRHQGLNRTDYPLYLAANEIAQNALILKQIQVARVANQPVVLICENDIESAKLMVYLQKALPNDEKLVRLSAQNDSRHEAEHIEKKAGLPGMVTLSTGMIGRGTDIPLYDKATEAGLKVLINYLPREREYYQIIGRAGRFGAKGDARLILNKHDLKKQLGKTSLKDGFYTATEAYIRQQHAIMDRQAQVERLIKFTIGDFRRNLTQNYFNDFFRDIAVPHQNYDNKPWSMFFKETDTKWTETWQILKSKLDCIDPNVAIIEQHLSEYQAYVQSKWTDLITEVGHQDLKSIETPEAHPDKKLMRNVGSLMLSADTKAIMNTFNASSIAPLKTAVYEKYDPAHDGKAVLYTRPFEKIRAIFRGERALFADFKAWKAGRGILFPNLRAWWNGNMTFGQLLFGGATKDSEIITLTPTVMPLETLEIVSSTRKMKEQLGAAETCVLPLNTANPESNNYEPILKQGITRLVIDSTDAMQPDLAEKDRP
ncbi:MAG: hypothetical protein Q8M03_16530 [Legionella sp.]|nr:hypothetical protein [Legionella sp.]